MCKLRFWLSIISLAAGFTGPYAMANDEPPVQLRTTEMPPYQMLEQGQLGGISVSTLSCAFSAIDTPYHIQLVPAKRAEHDVKTSSADGFFSSIQHAEADQFARLSAPLAMEKWFLVSRSETVTPNVAALYGLRLGAIRGSSEAQWLQRELKQAVHLVAEEKQLIQQLEAGRIDAFITEQRRLTTSFERWLNRQAAGLRLQFLRYAELGVYFQRNFLLQRPGFLTRFNRALGDCNELEISLNEAERGHLQTKAEAFLQTLNHNVVKQALRERLQNPVTATEIADYEKRWQAEYFSGEYQFIASMQSLPVSDWLMQKANSIRDGFTEIILFDRQGALTGFSRVPNDYDQSDENKFAYTIGTDEPGVYLSDIVYDRSTQRFQAQFSAPVLDSDGTVLGAITLGLDTEYLLSGATVPLALLLIDE
ncbi:ABC-type amino acid transport substrate-binding protein [Pseudidiomarina planktonica]|uniref:ABC-type amino acid transport substrate-binding protein n=2 Tax=Pseudidiomarina planktonica TaxID=1323738 RepID=A0A1Y6EY81_9GAMM|nr:ABC-type amino acid transport substrate-binding protein [Pseudidiomarina planktonica]